MAKAPTEKHLEDWIVNNLHWFGDLYDNEYLYGFENHAAPFGEDHFVVPMATKIVGRQLQLPDGIADLVVTDHDRLMVVELKKGDLSFDVLGQCLRYMNNLTNIFNVVEHDVLKDENPDKDNYYYDRRQTYGPSDGFVLNEITGVIVGHKLTDRNLLLAASMCDVEVFTYELHSNGVYTFERQFPSSKSTLAICEQYLDAPLGVAMRHLMRCKHDRQVERNGGLSDG